MTERRLYDLTLALVIVLTLFRWVTLCQSTLNLQFDEAQYWGWSRDLAFGYVSKPPLIAWIIHASTWLLGDGEAGIRAAAPLLHAVTALLLYALGERLYGRTVGFWSAVTYATLPAVSYSSLIISTDAVLLPFWAGGLLAWWSLIQLPSLRTAILLGLCIGAGLLAKYAMAYFILCAVVHVACSPEIRRKLRPGQLVVVLLVALAVVAPNLMWNFAHGWATFSHTADNADWQGARKGGFMPMLEFLGGQAGVLGPVLAVLAIIALLRRATYRSETDCFLACFCLPVLALVTVQSLLAGAHLNWAVTAYLSLVVLVVNWSLFHAPKFLTGSLALHGVILVAGCLLFAGHIQPRDLPKGADLFGKLRGWKQVARAVDEDMLSYPGYSLLFDERKYAVLFAYYLRDKPYHLVIWPFMGKAHSQFAMTNAIDAESGKQAILISRWPDPGIENQFATSKLVGVVDVKPTMAEDRKFRLFQCDGLKQVP